MPSWKKLIQSGSNAELNHITSSGEISASGGISASSFVGEKLQLIHPVSGSVANLGKVVSQGKIVNTFAGNNVRNVFGGTADNTGTTDVANNFYGSSAYANFFAAFDVDGEEVMKGGGSVAGGDLLFQFGDVGGADNELKFQTDVGNGKFNFLNGPVDIQGTTDATNASGDTGILRVEGGASIAKKVYVGTQLSVGSHITASGDISASGKLLGNILNLQGKQALTISSGELSVGKNTFDTLYNSPNHEFKGHITASGNISASGDVFASNVFINGENALKESNGQGYLFDDAQITKLQIGKQGVVTQTTIDGPITASGDISASGDLYADNIYLEKGKFIQFGSGDTYISASGATEDLVIAADDDIILEPDDDVILKPGGSNIYNQGYYGGMINGTADTDTKIGVGFPSSNQIFFYAGDGTDIRQLIESSEVSFRTTDVRMYGNSTTDLFFSDFSANKIGIRAGTTPPSTLTVGGDISASGNIEIDGNAEVNQITASAFQFIGSGTAELEVQGNVTASGNISSSGTIIGNEFIGGTTQNTGSYDFPGAILGYNAQGVNVADASYSLTTSYAVPDTGFNICFVAPKSGIVEIEAQIYVDGGSSGNADFFLGLSDNSSYNAVQSYYEVNVYQTLRFAHDLVKNNWVVSGLTAGTTYKYWLGAKVSSTGGTPKLYWGANTNNEYPPFIMKATALPSNADIES